MIIARFNTGELCRECRDLILKRLLRKNLRWRINFSDAEGSECELYRNAGHPTEVDEAVCEQRPEVKH